jgi:Ca2+-binding RTX toxin-like protein
VGLPYSGTVSPLTLSYRWDATVGDMVKLSALNYGIDPVSVASDNAFSWLWSVANDDYSLTAKTTLIANNRLVSNGGSDVLDGGLGNDWMAGQTGDDLLDGGAGDDILYGDDKTGVVASTDQGNDILLGGAGNDRLFGGGGNDYMVGGDGADTYLIAQADGVDVVKFTDLLPSDLTLPRHDSTTDDLILKYGTGGQLTIEHFYSGANDRVDQLQFSDGTVWSWADIEAKALTATEGDDTLIGFANESNTLSGLGGNDTLIGANLVDTLKGNDGDDTLIGNAGNDTLEGGNGADTYIFSKGDGTDTVNNVHSDTSADVVKFTDVLLTDLTSITRSSNNLILKYGLSDSVTVSNYFTDASYRVSQFQFANGDTLPQIIMGNSNNNTLTGTTANDALNGLVGADTMKGGLVP